MVVYCNVRRAEIRDVNASFLLAGKISAHGLHIQPVTAGLFYPKRSLSGFQQQLLVGVGKGTAARGVQRLTGKWLNVLNTLGGDLPVSQAVSFGVALFFSDCKALATAAVRFPFRRLQKYF